MGSRLVSLLLIVIVALVFLLAFRYTLHRLYLIGTGALLGSLATLLVLTLRPSGRRRRKRRQCRVCGTETDASRGTCPTCGVLLDR
jgi:hypothetical protein